MGNLAVRNYIYSEKVFGPGKGFYNEDIEKVVFIAPPLLGSDNALAMAGFWTQVGWKGYGELTQLMEDAKVGKLKNVEQAMKDGDYQDAKDLLEAFINQVKAQTPPPASKALTTQEAADLTNAAQALIDYLKTLL